jgi:hypothetical protein
MNFQQFPSFNINPPVFQPLNPASYWNPNVPRITPMDWSKLTEPIAQGIQNALATHLQLEQMKREAGWRQTQLGLENQRLQQQGKIAEGQQGIENRRVGEEIRHDQTMEGLQTPFAALTGVKDSASQGSPIPQSSPVPQADASQAAPLPSGGGSLDTNSNGNSMGLFPSSADLSGGSFNAAPLSINSTVPAVHADLSGSATANDMPDLTQIPVSQTTASNADSGIVARPPVAGSKAFELSLSGQPQISLDDTKPQPAPAQSNQPASSPYDSSAADVTSAGPELEASNAALSQPSPSATPKQAAPESQATQSLPYIKDGSGSIISLPFEQRRKSVMDQLSARRVVQNVNGVPLYQDESGRPYATAGVVETENGLEERRAYPGMKQLVNVPLIRKYNLPASLIQEGLHQNVVADQWTSPQEFAQMMAAARQQNGAVLNDYQQKFLDQAESQLQRGQEHLEDRARPYTEALNTLEDGYRQGNNLGDAAMAQALQSLLRGGTPGRGPQAQQLLTQGQGLLDRFQGAIAHLQGQGQVDPQVRQEVYQFGRQLANSHIQPFQQQLDQMRQMYVGRGKVRGVPEDAFMPRQLSGYDYQQQQQSGPGADMATAHQPSYPMMPSSKALLQSGKIYQTPRGPATWDGTKFNSIQ